jgi:hypothetical protein
MKIRLWTLGNFENKIFPTAEAIEKLRKVVAPLPTEGVGDIFWGPELSCAVIDTGEDLGAQTDVIASNV